MAKQVKFNISLNIDGKKAILEASADSRTLAKELGIVQDKSRAAGKSFADWSLGLVALNALSNAVGQISSSLNAVTEENRAFASSMRDANTMAGKGAEGFAAMKDKVSELAKEIPTTREALAQGLYQVISNGVGEEDWFTYLRASARAATGGLADVGEVVKVTSTIIKNYGKEWAAAGEVQDKIQLTAKNGVTSFEQLAQALPSVTGQAAQLGVTLDEMLAVFSTLTGVTGNTSEVSTQLGSVLTALTKETEKSQKAAQEMGITFNAASIRAAGGLANFLTELDQTVTAYASKTGQLKESIYTQLFGRAEALRLVQGLTGAAASRFAENLAQLENSAGTIDDAFDEVTRKGSATTQMLKNHYHAVMDNVAAVIGGAQPYLNFASQLGVLLISIKSVTAATRSLSLAKIAATAATKGLSVAALACGMSYKKGSIVARVFAQANKDAAHRVLALKVALRGLMVTTVVGAALTALVYGIGKFSDAMARAKAPTEQLASGLDELAEKSKQAQRVFADTQADTYSRLMSAYKALQAEWRALSSDHERTLWIKTNRQAFADLGLEVTGVQSAEQAFATNTGAVVQAFTARAKAAARMAQLTEEYRVQMEMADKIRKADETNRLRNQVKAGDIVRTPGEFSRTHAHSTVGGFEQVDRHGNWVYTEQGAARHNAQDWTDRGALATGYRETLEQSKRRVLALEADIAAEAQAAKGATGAAVPVPEPKAAAIAADTKTENPEATRSVEEYEQRLRYLREQATKETDESKAAEWQREYEEAARGLEGLRVRIGMEKPDAAEVHTYVDGLREQLAAARTELEDATTVEARVTASAKADELQRQIDEATTGRISIAATAAPSYVAQGSTEDKRASYANAEQRAQRVSQDYEIGIIGADEARAALDEINAALGALGLDPIVVELKTRGAKEAEASLQQVTANIAQMGQSLSGIGGALEVPELNVAGTVAQAIATLMQGYATASAQSAAGGPFAWAAFTAAGLAQIATVVASVKNMAKFATGGIVGGSSTTGDRLMVRVNSGEMILNKQQQLNLLRIINGGALAQQGLARAATALQPRQSMEVNVPGLQELASLAAARSGGGTIEMKVKGRYLRGLMNKEDRHNERT